MPGLDSKPSNHRTFEPRFGGSMVRKSHSHPLRRGRKENVIPTHPPGQHPHPLPHPSGGSETPEPSNHRTFEPRIPFFCFFLGCTGWARRRRHSRPRRAHRTGWARAQAGKLTAAGSRRRRGGPSRVRGAILMELGTYCAYTAANADGVKRRRNKARARPRRSQRQCRLRYSEAERERRCK